MSTSSIRIGSIVRGPTLPEPVEVLALVPLGDSLKVIGRGLYTGLTHDPVLNAGQLAQLTVSAEQEPFDGDARLFRLGVEAQRLGVGLRVRPVLLALHRPRRSAAAPARSGLRLLPAAAPHPLPAGRRSRGRQDDHGRPAAQGTEGPRPGPPHADRHAGQPDLPVAARTGRQVPREVRRHPRRRAAGQLRPEPLAGTRPGHHLRFLGLARRRRPRKPAPLPLGPGDRRRGPQDERPGRGPQDLRLPAGRGAVEDDRPLSC